MASRLVGKLDRRKLDAVEGPSSSGCLVTHLPAHAGRCGVCGRLCHHNRSTQMGLADGTMRARAAKLRR